MTSLTKKLTVAFLAVAAAVCITFGLLFAVPQNAYAETVDPLPTECLDIDEGVFKGLKNMDSWGNKNFALALPDGVTGIAGDGSASVLGSYASKLVSLSLPSSLTAIGNYAFKGCTSLKDVSYGTGIELATIGQEAFSGCTSLTSITIPASVTSLGIGAFNGCSKVTAVNFNAVNLESAYATANPFSGIGGANVTISGVNILPTGLFYNTKIKSVTFDGVTMTTSGSWAAGVAGVFENCTSLASVVFNDNCNVGFIGGSAFKNCTSLERITILSSVTTIGTNAFLGCTGLLEVLDLTADNIASDTSKNGSIPNSTLIITSEGQTQFSEESGFVFFNSKTGKKLLRYEGELKDITLPVLSNNGKYVIANNAFRDNSEITSVTIPSNVTEIGENAFMNCTSLTSISIPNSVNEIKAAAFYGCSSLSSVTLAEGISAIGTQMFMNCTSLTEIDVPSTVLTIGGSAFEGCSRLGKVNFQAYKWKDPASSADDEPEAVFYRLNKIETQAFKGCTSLTTIKINDAK